MMFKKVPIMAMRKNDALTFMREHSIPIPEKIKPANLNRIIENNIQVNVIVKMAQDAGHAVLTLPP